MKPEQRYWRNLSRMLEPMALDEGGLCEVCSRVATSEEP
jgi:hypothetical protein